MFIPHYSDDGTVYLAVADISIDYIDSLLSKSLYRNLLVSLLFLLFAYPLYLALVNRVKRIKQSLEETVEQQTSELVSNEERLKCALAAGNQAWFEVDFVTGKIIVSDNYPKMLGYEAEEFETNLAKWQQSIHPDDHDDVMAAFQSVRNASESFEIEYRHKSATGNWFWIQTMGEVTQWDPDNKPLRLVGVHMDVTQRKQNEEVLRVLAESNAEEDNDIFKVIIRQLAETYGVRHVFITRIDKADALKAKTVATWVNHDLSTISSMPLKARHVKR